MLEGALDLNTYHFSFAKGKKKTFKLLVYYNSLSVLFSLQENAMGYIAKYIPDPQNTY